MTAQGPVKLSATGQTDGPLVRLPILRAVQAAGLVELPSDCQTLGRPVKLPFHRVFKLLMGWSVVKLSLPLVLDAAVPGPAASAEPAENCRRFRHRNQEQLATRTKGAPRPKAAPCPKPPPRGRLSGKGSSGSIREEESRLAGAPKRPLQYDA